ncbi:hypothetical protein EYF80_006317 [Liparis tanakae]|uniref:Uncharacterized protein n=1 Tax=Liparis tanakae TaxID=230148 RepID=A0A4Z2IZN1_9TELE|nr:hypothetical protein EYF80_006317 [Liparis tanakae]
MKMKKKKKKQTPTLRRLVTDDEESDAPPTGTGRFTARSPAGARVHAVIEGLLRLSLGKVSRLRHSAGLSRLGRLALWSSSLNASSTLMLSLAEDSRKLWFQSSSTVDSTSSLDTWRSLWRSILLPITTMGVNLSSLISRISSRRLFTASRDWGSSTA